MNSTTTECRKMRTPAERAEEKGFNYHADCWLLKRGDGVVVRMTSGEAEEEIDKDASMADRISLDEDAGEFAGMTFRLFFS